ncbi:MAG: DUF4163 domain-containing protein [Oscillospiraceae bacterium]|nr:DUF4163 domain-containing protein [Oscillospiraceae bacterium]
MAFSQKKRPGEPVCAELEDFNERQAWEHDDKIILETSITLPKISGIPSKAAERINRHYIFLSKFLLRWAKTSLLQKARENNAGNLAEPYKLAASYTVTYNDKGILSLYYEISQHSPAQPLAEVRCGDSWSLEDGLPYPLPLPRRSKGIKACLNAMPPGTDPLAWKKAVYRHYQERNSYLTPKGIVLYFPACTLPSSKYEFLEFHLTGTPQPNNATSIHAAPTLAPPVKK